LRGRGRFQLVLYIRHALPVSATAWWAVKVSNLRPSAC